MAKLVSDELAMEVRYRSFDWGWVTYDIIWTWDGKPILNDAILKRTNDYWKARSDGGLHLCEGTDFIIPLVERVLATDQADYFETTDPDVIFAVYPQGQFPFIPKPHSPVIFLTAKARKDYERQQARKRKYGKLPEDIFTIIVAVDTYNFRGAKAYSGEGPALRMYARRDELEKFTQTLRTEYYRFKKRNKVDEYSINELGLEDAKKLRLFGDCRFATPRKRAKP